MILWNKLLIRWSSSLKGRISNASSKCWKVLYQLYSTSKVISRATIINSYHFWWNKSRVIMTRSPLLLKEWQLMLFILLELIVGKRLLRIEMRYFRYLISVELIKINLLELLLKIPLSSWKKSKYLDNLTLTKRILLGALSQI